MFQGREAVLTAFASINKLKLLEQPEKDVWQGEVRMRRCTGDSYPAWLMVSAVYKGSTSGEVVNFIATSIDITDRKAHVERIRFLAHHDVLTELPNRSLCQQRLAEALKQALAADEKVAVLFIDLDRFKLVNDTVSRLGGDEFVIIMRHVRDHEELDLVVNQRIVPSPRQTAVVEGHSISVSCSVGIAVFPDDAMARFFSNETDLRILARQTMDAQLRQALGQAEFSLHYQPRLCARTRRMLGAEALLRWDNPLLGSIAPAEFIPLAEETGLIKAIGLWVPHEACAQWVQFQSQGLFEAVALSVNLSAAQLADPDLVGQLQQVLERTGLPAQQLELELTESNLMDNPNAAQEQVSALKAMGIHIAIDDFGTGYSSLAYLKRFEIDILKIDQSFVRGILDDRADAAIVHAVIALGCDELQGYCFSRPLAVQAFQEWVQNHGTPPQRRRAR